MNEFVKIIIFAIIAVILQAILQKIWKIAEHYEKLRFMPILYGLPIFVCAIYEKKYFWAIFFLFISIALYIWIKKDEI